MKALAVRQIDATQMPPCLGTPANVLVQLRNAQPRRPEWRVFDKNNSGKSDMRNLILLASAALLLSTGAALAQGSGAAGDIGSGVLPRAAAPATVGQSATEPATPAPAPKAAKKTAKKKK
jgi:hypothetical protein